MLPTFASGTVNDRILSPSMRTAATLGGVGRAGGAGNGTAAAVGFTGAFPGGTPRWSNSSAASARRHDFFAGPRAFLGKPFMFLLVGESAIPKACANGGVDAGAAASSVRTISGSGVAGASTRRQRHW